MTVAHPASPLTLVGLGADDERLYRLILRSGASTPRELTEISGLAVDALERELARFAASGLVEVRDGRVHALEPDLAFGPLLEAEVRRLESESERVDALRSLMPSLRAERRSGRERRSVPDRPLAVEAFEGGDVVELIRVLAEESTGDLMWLRPDQWRLPMTADLDSHVRDLVAGGRRSRAIYPARVLEEAPAVLRARAEVGEQVRILASVPSRVSVFEGSSVLLSDRWGENTGRRLVVREHAVVGGFAALFESLWERGVAVPGLDGQQVADRGQARRLLLHQLAAGAKDEQIARALGLGLRTVRRRVADLMGDLGVDSRFQAGVEAVRRGWI